MRQAPEKVRKPGSGEGTYEEVRIREVTRRAEVYELRVNWLKAELLDRRGLEVELGHVFDAIRAIIEGTRMTKEEKTDCLAQLMPVKQVLAIIAEKQARLEPITTARVVVNGEDD